MPAASPMQKFKKGVDRVLAWTLTTLSAVLVIDVLWQIVSRYLLENPSSFTEELARFLLIWVGFLGASYAAGQRMHLAVDILPNKMKGRKKVFLDVGLLLGGLVFVVAVMVFGGTRLVQDTFNFGQTAAALQVPLGYVYIALPLSGLLIVFYTFVQISEEWSKLKTL